MRFRDSAELSRVIGFSPWSLTNRQSPTRSQIHTCVVFARYNSTLSTLDLRGNNLGDEGCGSLAASLQIVNETLTSLDLGYNEIKDEGAYMLASAIKGNGGGVLNEIKLNNNYITKFGEVALTEAAELVQEMNEGKELEVYF